MARKAKMEATDEAKTGELLPANGSGSRELTTPKPTPLPAFTSSEMGEALKAYRDLQGSLDEAMPDQIMQIRGKPFRKKGYWRAIATAFNLEVVCTTEHREDVGEDWGWLVTYRATASSGRSADGDGACFATEKKDRDGAIIATEHNVRSHAHTRAYNRAVSNLVAFGEVSAEEVNQEGRGGGGSSGRTGDKTISDKQAKRMWAKAKTAYGDDAADALRALLDGYGYQASRDITRKDYDMICDALDKAASKTPEREETADGVPY